MTHSAFGLLVRPALCLVLAASLFATAPAAGQTANETSVMADRLNRLETELNQLERQVYRGGSTPSGAPAQAGGAQTVRGVNPDNAADLAARMDQFDERMSELNGRLEEIDHQDKLLASRIDKLSADIDFRFKALEHGGAPAPQSAAPTQPPADEAAPGQAAPGQAGDAEGSTLGKPPAILGTLRADAPTSDQQQAAVAPPPPPSAPAVVKLPPGSVQSQYNFATDLLHQGDYAGAEQALAEFISQHPTDPLASAAQYWLGETFFVRQRYDRAAKAFLAGYQKYPKTQKAPDDLLKLAMSLTALNQKKEACAVFQQLSGEYPNAESRIKQSAAREKSKAGCS